VEVVSRSAPPEPPVQEPTVATAEPTDAAIPPPAPAASPSVSRTAAYTRLGIGGLALVLVIGVVAWVGRSPGRQGATVTLAVLPFENLGRDETRDYLAAGLTEETSATLAQVDPRRLSVRGRTTHYKGTTKTAAEIGRELAVDYLVQSTIQAEGDRLRITATLIRVSDQEHVWSRSYDREPTSLLGLQQDLSTAIAEQIRVRLAPDPSRAERQTKDSSAYDAYLRGRYFQSRRTPSSNALAIEQFRRAIALDPDYALAWSSLAYTYAGGAVNGDALPLAVWPLARDAAAQAVRASADLADAQFVVGYVNWLLDWDWPAAEARFRRAAALEANSVLAWRALGHALSQAGRHTEGAAAMRRARELDPLDPLTAALSSQVAFQGREYRQAIDFARRAVLLDSTFWIGYVQLGQAYERVGQPELALEALTDAARLSGNNSKVMAFRGYVLATTGRAAEAREVLRTLDDVARQRYVPPYAMALVHAGLGERDAVFAWLDKAYAARDVHLIYLPVDVKWDPYRSDARFAALLARCQFVPQK
jgi:TolB-like protein/Tfp pilus assembly protein PilF